MAAEEGPNYHVTNRARGFEIRKYEPSIVAEVTIDPMELTANNQNGGFTDMLANYVGALIGEISATGPVFTRGGEGHNPMTVQVGLPEQENAAFRGVPQPMDPRVVVKRLEKRTYAVATLHGGATDEVVQEEVRKLKRKLEENDYKVVGEHLLASCMPFNVEIERKGQRILLFSFCSSPSSSISNLVINVSAGNLVSSATTREKEDDRLRPCPSEKKTALKKMQRSWKRDAADFKRRTILHRRIAAHRSCSYRR
ncbi:hypothetical protein EJ110_NYTH09860 [Nymphaea thermarum]|nr:hypothetical protein EJ110_NYTH09860 [Nymphaea thermarum]